MGADLGGVRTGDLVAVWGAGAVGLMAARAAALLGADRLIVMHRGRKVTEKKTAETNTPELVQYMVGVLDDTR